MPFLHGRHVGPLLTTWTVGFLVVAGLYWLQLLAPALIDIITPLYVIVAVVTLAASWKWFRERGHERRRAFRRHGDRRGDREFPLE